MKRRDLLKFSLSTASGLWLSQFGFLDQALAQEKDNAKTQNSFLVLITLDGGWMTNLAMDPWIHSIRPSEKDYFIEYREDEVFRSGQVSLGPAMASLNSYASQMNMINGIFMSPIDNGHDALRIYATSGNGTGIAGDLSVENELTQLQQSPLGVLHNFGIYSGNKNSESMSLDELRQLDNSSEVEQPFTNPQSPISKSLKIKKANATKLQKLSELKNQLSLSGKNVTDSHILALAYKLGLSRSSHLKITSNDGQSLDTHADHPIRHLQSQKKMWTQVKEIFDSFKDIEFAEGRSMFDETTFFITSEFSRTPSLDASKGTNHNPLNNSAILIGPNFKGNSVFGASRLVTAAESANEKSYLIGQMVNFETGSVISHQDEARKVGSLVKPESVIATLAEGLNIQRNIFTPIQINQKPIKQLLKG